MPSFYEFFAGGGMARAGLGKGWECLLANDIDEKKGASYAANWGKDRLRIEDVGALTVADLPVGADLAWASFPCQDLSLAGDYVGLRGKRSGTFWLFWRLMKKLAEVGNAPSLVVLENVCGALTSHGGKDFSAIGSALSESSYRWGALVIDAARLLPQSRPRLFVVGVKNNRALPEELTQLMPDALWHPHNLIEAYRKLPDQTQSNWGTYIVGVPLSVKLQA